VGVDYEGKKIGMWMFLFTELLFFGGMFLLYTVYRYRFALDFHNAAKDENIVLGSLNTFILLTSSFMLALAISALRKGKSRLSIFLQLATIVMGIAFLVIKLTEWAQKINVGLYPNSPALLKQSKGQILYFGLYYVMTGIHGLHVLIGICVISVMVVFTTRKKITQENPIRLENTGLYWHFVDIIWLYLFPLFYLIT
jgi:cytochrome c oxidase subunit 3